MSKQGMSLLWLASSKPDAQARDGARLPRLRVGLRSFLPACAIALFLAGCQQKMADQPSYKPLDACSFFADGRSARPLVSGTVPRGYLKADTALWTGRRTALAEAQFRATIQPKEPKPVDEKMLYADFVEEFPFPITEPIVQHGYHRYMIYCVVCHDPLGTGHGKIVERGYTQPPSYHIERLRKAPVGHLFAVISEGYGSMPSYANQIPVRDRWAIVAYLRALQASQHTNVSGTLRVPFGGTRSVPDTLEAKPNDEPTLKEQPPGGRAP
jgi:hypothetical protein